MVQLARKRYPESLLGAELALGDLVREAGRQVLARLGGDPRLSRECAVPETVLAGGSVRHDDLNTGSDFPSSSP